MNCKWELSEELVRKMVCSEMPKKVGIRIYVHSANRDLATLSIEAMDGEERMAVLDLPAIRTGDSVTLFDLLPIHIRLSKA